MADTAGGAEVGGPAVDETTSVVVSRRTFMADVGKVGMWTVLAGAFGAALDACSSGSGLTGPYIISFDDSGTFQGTAGGQALSGASQPSSAGGSSFVLTGSLGGTSFTLSVNFFVGGIHASGTWGSQRVDGVVRSQSSGANGSSPAGSVSGTIGGTQVAGTIQAIRYDNGGSGGTVSGSVL
jgi:hypothetical protein